MPEGDTLHKLAAILGPKLVGARLEGVWLREEDRYRPGPRGVPLREAADLAGSEVEAVEAVGKHLLVRLPTAVIRVHLGMDGTFHRYSPGERWKMPEHRAWLVLATATDEVVCFDPKTVERARPDRPIEALARLGPDLLGEVPWEQIPARARAADPDDGTIATLLLDQTVAAGIGNVVKCEALFLEGIDPRTPRDAVGDDALVALYRRASEVLKTGVRPGGRRTTAPSRAARPVGTRPPGPRFYVYGRAGRPCLRCGTRIETCLLGRHARNTEWCPKCQPRP